MYSIILLIYLILYCYIIFYIKYVHFIKHKYILLNTSTGIIISYFYL